MSEIRISEQEVDGQKVYHWQILDGEGREFSHSAYHTDRTECQREAEGRLAHARREGWIDMAEAAECPYCRKSNPDVNTGTAHECVFCGETFTAGAE